MTYPAYEQHFSLVETLFRSDDGNDFVEQAVRKTFPGAFMLLEGEPVKGYSNALDIQASNDPKLQTYSKRLSRDRRWHPEFDRTAYSLYLLHAVMHGKKEAFHGLSDDNFRQIQQKIYKAVRRENAPHVEDMQLTAEGKINPEHVNWASIEEIISFQAVHEQRFKRATASELAALLSLHDTAKIREVADALAREGINVSDHDRALLVKLRDLLTQRAFAARARNERDERDEIAIIFLGMSREQQERIVSVLIGGVNPGRVMQLEATPGEFQPLLGYTKAINQALYVAFHILDIAAIRGHYFNAYGTEPFLNAKGKPAHVFWNGGIHAGFLKTFELCASIGDAKLDPVAAYDAMRRFRGKEFGFTDREMDQPSVQAAIRLKAMFRGPLEARRILEKIESRSRLIEHLNKTGFSGRFDPAICIGYAPDMSQNILNTITEPEEAFDVWADSLEKIYDETETVIQADLKAQRPSRLVSTLTDLSRRIFGCPKHNGYGYGLDIDGRGQVTIEFESIVAALSNNPRLFLEGGFRIEKAGTTLKAVKPAEAAELRHAAEIA